MIYRKIFGNILVSLLSPIFFSIRWLPNVYEAIIFKKYTYYDLEFNSLGQYLLAIYGNTFVPLSLFSFFLIFVPFQTVKDYFLRTGRPLNFLKKVAVLSGYVIVLVLVWGMFTNLWTTPWYNNLVYLIYAFVFGFVFAGLLYLMIDRYKEKKSKIEMKQNESRK